MSRNQLVEQRLGVLQVGGVEALGEPVVDFGEHRARFVALALLASSRARLVVAPNSGDLALCRWAISIAVRKHRSASATSDGFCASNSSPLTRCSDGLCDLRPGLRDGSESLLQHLKSFLGPSGFSEPGGQKTQIPRRRPPVARKAVKPRRIPAMPSS